MESEHKIILYVDDDDDDRQFLKDVIERSNPEMEVEFAHDGLEALAYLSARKEANSQLLCLIVLDINMPFLDGKETFERIKKEQGFQQVPIIVFSSSEKPADRQLFNSRGVEYFSKPTSVSYMQQIVNRMLKACSC